MRVQVPPAAHIEKAAVEAYVIGVALGDGNLSCPNGRATRLRVTCDSSYPLVSKEITEALEILFPNNKVSRVERSKAYFDISVYSNTLNDLLPWEVGHGSKIKQNAHVPEWIMNNKNLMRACLRGLIQTDGCIYNDRGYKMMHFTNCIHVLALDAYVMMRNLGYEPRIYSIPTKTRTKYVVRLAKKTQEFLNEVAVVKA